MGFEVTAQPPEGPSDPAVREEPAHAYVGFIFATTGNMFGWRPASVGDDFDSERTGLDHPSSPCRTPTPSPRRSLAL